VMTNAIQARHPGIELTVLSQSSIEILRNLEDFAIDVGLTYLDNEPIEGMRSEAVYMERYCLLVRLMTTVHPGCADSPVPINAALQHTAASQSRMTAKPVARSASKSLPC